MAKERAHQKMKNGAALLALLLAAVIPFAALAETTAQEAPAAEAAAGATVRAAMPGRGGRGFAPDGYSLDTSSLTQEQKAVYDSAIKLYEQVEDAVLSDLVTAGVVAQADADSYIALRAAQKSLQALDQSGWTARQYKAYYEANAKTGDERKAAMQALAEAGQLTQDQAGALGAQGESGLWAAVLKNASTNSVIQTAVSTMRQARETLNSTLADAGIAGRGLMFEGFGTGIKDFRQGMDRNVDGSNNESNNKNLPKGGRDGRK